VDEASTPANSTDNLTFEQAIQRLEETVEAMEEGEIPLQTLIEHFENGTRMLRFCQQQLRHAELKIELLTKDGSDESLERFDPAS